jgi:hypothetical protein
MVPCYPLGCDTAGAQNQKRHKDIEYTWVDVDVIGLGIVLMIAYGLVIIPVITHGLGVVLVIPYEGGQERRDSQNRNDHDDYPSSIQETGTGNLVGREYSENSEICCKPEQIDDEDSSMFGVLDSRNDNKTQDTACKSESKATDQARKNEHVRSGESHGYEIVGTANRDPGPDGAREQQRAHQCQGSILLLFKCHSRTEVEAMPSCG